MEFFNLDRRSVIRDGVDLRALLSNDMRDIHWSILDKLTPPQDDMRTKEPPADEPVIIPRANE